MARKKLEGLATAFNTRVVMRLFQGPYVSVYHDGVENRISVTTGGRNSPPYLILKQLTPLGFKLSISKENPMTRGLGSIGLFKDVEVGNPAFDEKYLIRSNDPISAQSFFQDIGRREITEYFFDKGFNAIKSDNEVFMIMKPSYEKEDLMQEQILPLLKKMRKLASG
jgi:hypothetical protein